MQQQQRVPFAAAAVLPLQQLELQDAAATAAAAAGAKEQTPDLLLQRLQHSSSAVVLLGKQKPQQQQQQQQLLLYLAEPQHQIAPSAAVTDEVSIFLLLEITVKE